MHIKTRPSDMEHGCFWLAGFKGGRARDMLQAICTSRPDVGRQFEAGGCVVAGTHLGGQPGEEEKTGRGSKMETDTDLLADVAWLVGRPMCAAACHCR